MEILKKFIRRVFSFLYKNKGTAKNGKEDKGISENIKIADIKERYINPLNTEDYPVYYRSFLVDRERLLPLSERDIDGFIAVIENGKCENSVVSRILCKWNFTGATDLRNGWLTG